MIRRRRSLGYTLQELMVVIAIVGIAAAVAAGRLGGKGRASRDADRFSERITSAFERARIQAVATRLDFRVVVGPTSVVISQSNGSGGWNVVERVVPPREAMVWDTKASHVKPTAASSTPHTLNFKKDFTFDLDGGPGVNAHVYVSGVGASTQQSFRIFVNAAGTVRRFENW
jgi:prepilin-type N-terminal cleavage/methylation domain-containing protein